MFDDREFKLPRKLWIVDKVPVAWYPSEGHWQRGFEPGKNWEKCEKVGKIFHGWSLIINFSGHTWLQNNNKSWEDGNRDN